MNARYSADTKIISANAWCCWGAGSAQTTYRYMDGDHYYDDKRFVLTEFSADTLKEEERGNIYMRMVGSIPELHIKGR